ncbi:GAP family protein [Mycobacterium sp. CPCC 205372]|uniref:GAP family protein n=1 Tax=Mycobacterium hippophais TaxID=3016340 RepID=A0ABT4Q1L1_9MYCO|nr:GAP family protein [Mycobacterium hippophais]MCZ8382748.1 GAP family protein [Mycobacterium hippophais]
MFGVALMGALNPLRLSAILLMISRPRPVRSLLAFWVGAVTVAVSLVLVPMFVLHDVQQVESLVREIGSSPVTRYIKLGAGLVLLTMAVLMLISLLRRPGATVSESVSVTATAQNTASHDDSHTPATGRHRAPAESSAATDDGPPIRRMIGRTQEAWKRGSLWMALVIGFMSAPAPDAVLLVLAVVLTSGASIGIQLSAGITYIVSMLVVVEAVIVSYAIIPARTECVLGRVRDWALRYRRQVVTAVLAMVGVGLTVTGIA